MNAIRLSIKYENAGGIFSGNQRIVRINREWQECRRFPGKIPRQIPALKKPRQVSGRQAPILLRNPIFTS